MTQQFIRACSLVVGDASGSGLDLANLRVTFNITHGTTDTPRVLSARVYNPNEKTVARLQSEFIRVTLAAGYQGNVGVIFDGTINQIRSGRENPVDTFVDIFAQSGDVAHVFSVSSAVLAAGWKHKDIHEQCAKDMAAAIAADGATQGTMKAGTFPEISGSGARPKVIYGMTRDICRTTAQSVGGLPVTDGDEIKVVSLADLSKPAQPGEPQIVLTPSSGLVGIPVQTIDGVQVTCLLSPQIKRGSLIHIRLDAKRDKAGQSAILPAQVDQSYVGTQGGNKTTQASDNVSGTQRWKVNGLPKNGLFRAIFAEHSGDTRGDEWYTRMTCISVDPSDMPAKSEVLVNAVD
ncbi:baseplate hub protein [Acetobacter sicerae]|uniref:baseplate hub protein n=1 Tax=Acetobacter sicerae TaxID=85325 RepID=UPI00156AFAAF|nr:hypothetical protein [Acetobacter sicerae]NHN93450.1 hypothetical protein [Acetobacter sicerae]